MEQGSNTPPAPKDAGTEDKSQYQVAMEAVASAQRNQDGILVLADGLTEDIKSIANLEISRRESQAVFTQGQQSLAQLEAENKILRDHTNAPQLSREQVEQLEELKHTDPDEWFAQRNKLEQTARDASQAALNEASQAAGNTYEMQRQQQVLAEFSRDTGFTLTQEILDNDVQPRLANKLRDGMEFGAWLSEVKTYLGTPKVAQNQKLDNVTDIGNSGDAGEASIAQAEAYGTNTIY